MKKHLNYWLPLLLLPLLGACHDEETMPGEQPGEADKTTVVHATITGAPGTRAQVQWGNEDASAGELFMWNDDDKIKVYNITTHDDGTEFTIGSIEGKNAEFSAAGFTATEGDVLLAVYGESQHTTATGGYHIIKPETPSSTRQIKSTTPGNEDLKHLQNSLLMYAIVAAGADNKIPELKFRHMSALMRVTVRNKKTSALSLSSLKFESNNIFPNRISLYGHDINITDTNWETWTKSLYGYMTMEVEGSLEPDESYDLFCAFFVEETGLQVTTPLTITLNGNLSTTIAGFNNLEIKPGYRYWFDLTVTPDGKLVQSSTLEPYAWYTRNPDATEFTVSTAAHLRELAGLVNGEADALAAANISGAVNFENKTVRLTANINLTGEAWTQGIGITSKPFKGTFDGGGYHINGLNVNAGDSNDAGLFGYVNGGTVRNLRVSGDVTTSGNRAGGIVGDLFGGTVENCLFNGSVNGATRVGGIAGRVSNGGRIARCHTRGSATATSNYAGGIAGYIASENSIEDCYSQAAVVAESGYAGGIVGYNGGSITRCYATGAISGTQYVGGISGNSNSASIKDCIALNPSLTRTGSGTATSFGRITGSGSVTNCAAFQSMMLPDKITATSAANGKHGASLAKDLCLTASAYVLYGFTTANGWAFDEGETWIYLPWNPAFKTFSGISEDDYRIKASVIN